MSRRSFHRSFHSRLSRSRSRLRSRSRFRFRLVSEAEATLFISFDIFIVTFSASIFVSTRSNREDSLNVKVSKVFCLRFKKSTRRSRDCMKEESRIDKIKLSSDVISLLNLNFQTLKNEASQMSKLIFNENEHSAAIKRLCHRDVFEFCDYRVDR